MQSFIIYMKHSQQSRYLLVYHGSHNYWPTTKKKKNPDHTDNILLIHFQKCRDQEHKWR